MQLIGMHYVPKHSLDHADLEYVSRGVIRNGIEYVGNKHTYKYWTSSVRVLN